MDQAKSKDRRRSSTALSYILLVLAFGVLVPYSKGLAFFDPVLMFAYACIGIVFSGPAAAQAFTAKPRSWGEAVRLILQSVLFGEVIAAVMLVFGIVTVYLTHLHSVFFMPDLARLGTAAIFGLTGSFALVSMGGWLTRRFSAGVARWTLRAVFFVLLIVFFQDGQWLPAAAALGIPVALALGAVFLELLRRELKPHETGTGS